MIGRMLFVGLSTSDRNIIKKLVLDCHVGGLTLYSRNYRNYEEMLELINYIHGLAEEAGYTILVGIDQEGYRVNRLPKEIVNLKSPYSFHHDLELIKKHGEIIATILSKSNININFAPVLDIKRFSDNHPIGDRCFGDDASSVIKNTIPYIKEFQNKKVIPVVKHFPGHGDTTEDSHKTLPIINKSKDELLDLELIPFINAIENGADVIMVGHLAVPQITGNNTPASLSKKIINDLLREELGFNGLVITDALNMDALTEEYTEEEIYINAINAGVDILLMPDFDFDTIKMISDAVTEGIIMEEEIEDSAEKILALKFDKLFTENTYSLEYLGSIKHQEIISRIDKILSN